MGWENRVFVVTAAAFFLFGFSYGVFCCDFVDNCRLPLLKETPAKTFVESDMSCDDYSMGLGVVYQVSITVGGISDEDPLECSVRQLPPLSCRHVNVCWTAKSP